MLFRVWGLASALAMSASSAPAQAELLSFQALKDLCTGETAEPAPFRTRAGHALLAETYRARCRMYLLGRADAVLQQRTATGGAACIRPDTPSAEVAEALAEGLLARTAPPAGGVGELVREVLRDRYGCAP